MSTEIASFLRDAMTTNVTEAFGRLGGSRGFQEVRSRNSEGPIEIELQIRTGLGNQQTLITYSLQLAEEKGRPIVEREILMYPRNDGGKPWHVIDFRRGVGEAVTNERDPVSDERDHKRETQTLKSADILAIKGLAQFDRFPTAVALGSLIENWHLSDFRLDRARLEQAASFGGAVHLSREGEDLPLVLEYLHDVRPKVFHEILTKLARRIPGSRASNRRSPRRVASCSGSRTARSRIRSWRATCRMARSRCSPILYCSWTQSHIRCYASRSRRSISIRTC